MKLNLEFDQDLDYIKEALVYKQNHLKDVLNEVAEMNLSSIELDFIKKFEDDILNIQGILDRLPQS